MPESWTLFLSYVKIQDTSVDSTKSSWIGEVSVPSTEKEAFFGWDGDENKSSHSGVKSTQR